MSDERARPRQLGRGLSALLGEERADYASLDEVRQSKTVPVEQLRPGRFQPRKTFDEGELDALASSIRERGLLQPILVRRDPDMPDSYEIVAGERRWRAAQRAQLHEVAVVVKDLSDGAALEVALIENIQRQNLDPVEEAEGYRRLVEEFGNTQEDLARFVGKSRSHIANTLRLLNLPETVQAMLRSGALTAGHGRELLASSDVEKLADTVVKQGLNVRQTERLVQETPRAVGRSRKVDVEKDADTRALERDLSELLGLAVTIRFDGTGGKLVISYKSVEQLDDVLRRLTGNSVPARGMEGDGA